MCRSRLLWGALLGAQALASSAFAQSREEPRSGQRGGHVELSIHARSTQSLARSERAAWLTLALPLDRAAVPRLAETPVVPSPPPPSRSLGGVPASFPQLRSLADFTRRATAQALAVVHTAAERQRLDSFSARARSSALLPEMRFRVLRNSDKALRWIPSTDDPYRITQADGTGLVLEGAMTFRLDRLVFAHEELAVERLRHEAAETRLKLERRVVEALLGLFRARERSCWEDGASSERPQEVLHVQELFAELDALTAGWFSAQAPSFGRAVWGFPEAVLGACSPPTDPPPPAPADAPAVSAGSAGTFAVASPVGSE